MNFLLDTNAVSEWVKPHPNPGVIGWMETVDEDRTFISVISLAELHQGAARLVAGKRKARLEQWIQYELPLRFENRILPITGDIAQAWGNAVAKSETLGRPLAAMDAFLAATAEIHHLTLVTRNTSEFSQVRSILNPWT